MSDEPQAGRLRALSATRPLPPLMGGRGRGEGVPVFAVGRLAQNLEAVWRRLLSASDALQPPWVARGWPGSGHWPVTGVSLPHVAALGHSARKWWWTHPDFFLF